MSETIRLLEADPELGRQLSLGRRAAATVALLAETATIDAGSRRTEDFPAHAPGTLGLLLLEGLILRRTELGGRAGGELLGPGDLLRPWQGDPEMQGADFEADWKVLTPARYAVLDARVAQRMLEYPELVDTLFDRTLQRARMLAAHLTIARFAQVESRLHLLFWGLAERYGSVTSQGLHVKLVLSHQVISGLIAVRRPAVTLGLGRLTERRILLRRADHTWLLDRVEPAEFGAAEAEPVHSDTPAAGQMVHDGALLLADAA